MLDKKDLINCRFDKLLVQEKTTLRDSSGNILWKCTCDCGKSRLATTAGLRKGSTHSCGCYRRPIASKDLSNQHFGKLLAIKIHPIRIYGAKIAWECLCECGKTTLVSSCSLTSGRTRSCGCTFAELAHTRFKKNSNTAQFNSIYSHYRGSARRRGHCFELNEPDFYKLITQNCYYCNSIPQQTAYGKYYGEEQFFYNGIDRVDNSLGYLGSNCVTCCGVCNRIKHTLGQKEFIAKVISISNHLQGVIRDSTS